MNVGFCVMVYKIGRQQEELPASAVKAQNSAFALRINLDFDEVYP